MRIENISKIRLVNQQITRGKFKAVKELVSYMGALQAQDYSMAKWAIGVRLKNAGEPLINSAIDSGEILRTHLLRPTWHFVSSDDINWILDLTAAGIKSSMKSRNKELGLTSAIFRKSGRIIEDALKGNNHLTREEVIQLLTNANIKTDQNRASHLLMEAELDGIICSGVQKGSKPTYSLLGERVKKSKNLNREQSLAKLAKLYFTSRGPATLYDFVWWSGLTVSDSRNAIEMIASEMSSFAAESNTYLYFKSSDDPPANAEKVFLLPAYDEFILGYKDRSAAMIFNNHKNLISANGFFKPVIVYKGKITGTWKRSAKNDIISLIIEYFDRKSKSLVNLVNKEAERYAEFTGKEIRDVEHKFNY